MLADEQFDGTTILGRVQHGNNVAVLFNAAALTEIRQAGARVLPGLQGAVELRPG
jgi:hypothetical protein